MTEHHRWPVWVEAVGFLTLVILAAVLRSGLDYRTAALPEATHLFGGWQVLHGQETHAMAFHPGWPPLSMTPLAWADAMGGLVGARALSAGWGLLTVVVVALTARRLYGSSAGFIAGGLVAVYGPAIHVGTFATQDSLGVFLVATAVHLAMVALTGGRRFLYVFVGLALALATVVHYVALVGALALIEFLAILVIASILSRPRTGADQPSSSFQTPGLLSLVGVLLPLIAVMIPYASIYRADLLAFLQSLVLTAQSDQTGSWQIFKLLRDLLWLPFLMGILAFDWRGRRIPAAGLLAMAAAWLGYQFWNRDTGNLVRLTAYVFVVVAPMAAGGLVTLGQDWGQHRHRWLKGALIGLLALGVIVYVGWSGQAVLAGNRGYWPDATQLVEYLRSHVSDGDEILMEQGIIGRYYLIAHPTPGHTPANIWDTWWYQDEEGEGSGADLYARAIRQGRFDFVVFDYTVSADLDRQLLPVLQDGYHLAITFPSDTSFSPGIEVYRRRSPSE